MKDGQLLSLETPAPADTGTTIARSGGDVVEPRWDALDSAQFFLVVSLRSGLCKRLESEASRDSSRRSLLPVSIQRLSVHRADAPGCEARVRLVYEGVPEMIDFFGLATWGCLRSDLFVWQRCPSAVTGCIGATRPVKLEPVKDWADGQVPTLALLETLKERGWRIGQPAAPHTLTSSRVFATPDPVASKAYLRCLVGLDVLIKDRGLPDLPVSEVREYYELVLDAKEPGTVPRGQKAHVYKQQRRPAPQEGQASDDDQNHGQEQAGPMLDDEYAPVVCRRGQRRGRGQQAKRRRRGGQSFADATPWASLLSIPDEAALAAQSFHPASGSSDVLVSSGQALASPAAMASSSAAPADALVQADASLQRRPADCYEFPVEGVVVLHDTPHGMPGQAKSYRRVYIKACPFHAPRCFPGKRMRRNFDTRDSQLTGLGDYEPYVFRRVGAWRPGEVSRAARRVETEPAPGIGVRSRARLGACRRSSGLAPSADRQCFLYYVVFHGCKSAACNINYCWR